MSRSGTPPPRPLLVRYGSRDGSAAPAGCPLCTAALPSARARYCSDACKQRAYRLRQGDASSPNLPTPPDPGRLSDPVAQTVYACPVCEARYLGERRCPDCNRFCRKLGPGGACPHCDEPTLVTELLGEEVLL